MSRHYDADLLASYREGLVSARRAASIRRHLSGCDICTATEAGLASVSAVLAGMSAPPMPDRLAERLQLAIASESAARAARSPALTGGSSQGAAAPAHTPGRPDLPERSVRRARRLRLPELPSSLILRGLAATAAVVIIASAGFLLASSQSPQTNTTAGSSPGARRASVPNENAANTPSSATVAYHRNGVLTSASATTSTVNFTRSNLAAQVRKQFTHSPGPTPSGLSATRTPSAPATKKVTDLNGFSISQLGACLTNIAAGRKVLLADVARYLGKPAAIIILQSPTASAYDVVVVGLACSSSGSDIIAKSEVAALPAG